MSQSGIPMRKPIILILAILALAALVFRVRTPLRNAIEGMRTSQCTSHLRAIGGALDAFHRKYGHFPPAYVVDDHGRPLCSWRVLLLEFLDPDLFKAYDFSQPWDGPKNRELLGRMPEFYRCPNRRGSRASFATSYVVIVGSETVFPGSRWMKETEIQDRPQGTLLVAEVANLEIPWMAPRDLEFDRMSFQINDPLSPSISSADRQGAGFLLVGGSIHRLAAYEAELRRPDFVKAQETLIRALITSNGRELAYFDDPF